MFRTLTAILAVTASISAAASLALFLGQRFLVFPVPPDVLSPVDAGIADLRATSVPAFDGTPIEVWREGQADDRPVALLFHGNGEVNGWTGERIAEARRAGYAVVAMEYRGYNGTAGRPSEEALVSDAEAVLAQLSREGFGADKIVLWGYSMGGGVAVQIAARHRVRGLVLEAPFLSLKKIAALRFPYLPVAPLVRDPFLSEDVAPAIRSPTLVVSGANDAVIPASDGGSLARLIGGARFVLVPDAGHNDLTRHPSARAEIDAFLKALGAGP